VPDLPGAKGDIVAADANKQWQRVAVGTDGQVLKANSAAGEGVEWGTLDKNSLGLDQVDNTADLDKPISNAVQAALDAVYPPVIYLMVELTLSIAASATKNSTFNSRNSAAGLSSPNLFSQVTTLPPGNWRLSNLGAVYDKGAGTNPSIKTTVRLSSAGSPFGALSALTVTTTVTGGFDAITEDAAHTVDVVGGLTGDRISVDIQNVNAGVATITDGRIFLLATKL